MYVSALWAAQPEVLGEAQQVGTISFAFKEQGWSGGGWGDRQKRCPDGPGQ